MLDDVLVMMNGIPIIKRNDIDQEKKRLFTLNPDLEEAWIRLDTFDTKEIDHNLLHGLVTEKIINEYLVSHNITTSDEYLTELKYMYEEQRRALNARYFSKPIVVTVSESEIKDFYETHKDNMLRLSVEEQTYVPYEEIRDRIKERLEDDKRGEAAMKKIEELKKEYNVEVHEDLVK